MDTSIIISFISLMGSLGLGVIGYLTIGRKAKSQIEVDGATFDRSLILKLQKQVDDINMDMKDLRKTYEAVVKENYQLKEELREAKHRISDLEQVNQLADDSKKI